MSTSDGPFFFRSACSTSERATLSRKAFRYLRELCNPGTHDDYSGDFALLLPAELAGILGSSGDVSVCGARRIYPVSTCWPMGHCWSSAVSQYVMADCCVAAGVLVQAFLCETNGIPACDAMAVSVTTDDVILFERSGNDKFVTGAVSPIFTRLDDIWTDRGIQSKIFEAHRSRRRRCGAGIAIAEEKTSGT